jgi:twitching motility protein PilT
MTIKEIFLQATKSRASDVHLLVGSLPMLRVDGELEPMPAVKKVLDKKDLEVLVGSILTEDQKALFLRERGLDFGFELDGARFRVNTFFEKDNQGLVARLISNDIPELKDLNLPPVVSDLLNLRQGLILVTGPTGCGKTTTLAAMVDYINEQRHANIITLEDPIEFIFKPKNSIIMQRQLDNDMLSFADGLRQAMRQDPNVIMVGEMRDLESIATTITLAETGHLVFATLHTYSAAQTIDRIIDIFPPHQQNQIRQQLSSVLACVISQRLLPRVSSGRVASREILINNPAVANLIRENKITQIRNVLETSSKMGMMTMDMDIKHLYRQKLISFEVAQNHMENPENLDR